MRSKIKTLIKIANELREATGVADFDTSFWRQCYQTRKAEAAKALGKRPGLKFDAEYEKIHGTEDEAVALSKSRILPAMTPEFSMKCTCAANRMRQLSAGLGPGFYEREGDAWEHEEYRALRLASREFEEHSPERFKPTFKEWLAERRRTQKYKPRKPFILYPDLGPMKGCNAYPGETPEEHALADKA